jgi:hypothetical protein
VNALGERRELLDVVGGVHPLEVGVGGESDTESFLSHGIGAGLQDLEGEAVSVLDGTAVLVSAVVRRGLGELVDEVAVCARCQRHQSAAVLQRNVFHGRMGSRVSSALCHSRAPCSSMPSKPALTANSQLLA